MVPGSRRHDFVVVLVVLVVVVVARGCPPRHPISELSRELGAMCGDSIKRGLYSQQFGRSICTGVRREGAS